MTPGQVTLTRASANGGDIEESLQFRRNEDALQALDVVAVAPSLQAVADCRLPVIAQIEGPGVGGGLGIAARCDLRICGEGSRFGIPVARLGNPLAPLEAQRVAGVSPLLRAHYAYAPSDEHREGRAAFIAKRPAHVSP